MAFRRAVVLVCAVLAALVVAGCGDGGSEPQQQVTVDSGGSSPTDGPSDATSSLPESPAESSPSDAGSAAATFDAKGSDIIPGDLEVSGDDQQAVADAWIEYWRVRAEAFHRAELDPDALGAVATGSAAEQVISYVQHLQSNQLHTVGDSVVGVRNVRIDGKTAVLESCFVNKSVDVDADGEPVEDLNAFYRFRGELTRAGGAWLVSDVSISSRTPC